MGEWACRRRACHLAGLLAERWHWHGQRLGTSGPLILSISCSEPFVPQGFQPPGSSSHILLHLAPVTHPRPRLCVTPPPPLQVSLDAEDIRNEKVKVLQSMQTVSHVLMKWPPQLSAPTAISCLRASQ